MTSFYLVLFGVLFVGVGSAFGEVSHLGFIERFPSIFVGAWGAGSGVCGLVSSLTYLLLVAINVPKSIIFFCFVPLALIYAVNFFFLNMYAEANQYFQVVDHNTSYSTLEEEDDSDDMDRNINET